MRSAILLNIILLTACASALAQVGQSEESYLARAGNVYVSEREFLERFELTPGFSRNRAARVQQEKADYLIALIAEKLLMQEALARGLDGDSAYQRALLDLTKLIARDALYQQEVRQKVAVSPREIQEGIRRATKQLHLTYLFFEKEEDARFVRDRLKKGSDLKTFRFDSSMAVLRDTASVVWGDADTTIENTAYALRPGELSRVVRAGDGFFIMRLDRSEPSEIYTKLQPEVLRERVTSTLRTRKEATRMEHFAAEILTGKSGYSPPATFREYASILSDVMGEGVPDSIVTLTPERGDEVLRRARSIMNDTLIVAGEKIWTVLEATESLVGKGFAVRGDVRKRVPRRLFDAFSELVFQELLAQEAIRRGLDRLPETQRQIAPWQDHYLASMMKQRLNDGVTVSETELFAYMKSIDSTVNVPMVRIRELKTETLEAMRQALGSLENGEPFQDVIERFSVDPVTRPRRGESDLFPVTSRPPIGQIAWEMNPGDRFGPVKDSTGLLLFELLEKRNVQLATDSSRLQQAATDLLQMKQKRRQTLFLAQTASQRGMEVYEDRLVKLKVSTIPMVTYRLLGFGGRMFVVPFVAPDVEWINEEPPQEQILP